MHDARRPGSPRVPARWAAVARRECRPIGQLTLRRRERTVPATEKMKRPKRPRWSKPLIVVSASLLGAFLSVQCGGRSGEPPADSPADLEGELSEPALDDEAPVRGQQDEQAATPEGDDDGFDVEGPGSEAEPEPVAAPAVSERCEEGDCKYECPKGARCDYHCPGGDCEVKCFNGSECALTCDAPDCQAFCEAGSKCKVRCPGGRCQTDCAPGAECKVSCAGGGCDTTCQNRSKCAVNCSGGGCKTGCVDGASCRVVCGGGDCTE